MVTFIEPQGRLRFIGKKEISGYIYYAHKQYRSSGYRIMRTLDGELNFGYYYGSGNFSVAWADPSSLSYGNPPD